MDSIETLTVTRTLRFRTDGTETAWLTVNGQGEKIVGQYNTREGGGWVAHLNANASTPLPNVDAETWRRVVRLVHLHA